MLFIYNWFERNNQRKAGKERRIKEGEGRHGVRNSGSTNRSKGNKEKTNYFLWKFIVSIIAIVVVIQIVFLQGLCVGLH